MENFIATPEELNALQPVQDTGPISASCDWPLPEPEKHAPTAEELEELAHHYVAGASAVEISACGVSNGMTVVQIAYKLAKLRGE